ncbi:cysteine hydrolase [Ligilactobacillus sp. WILCCON 0076]|uniref:Cysteine hydrolase n=1 Tax=Ligilactobacillus ubinensis TaxID=2876789 RepID=A0A9X2FGC7_9LACO|nr:isochorismatase family cysteine hydrolase [Ligilactobacillus ubinensis]MCP0885932.1 cysteine hydrolase [Ligilactobacillus ubinensis]
MEKIKFNLSKTAIIVIDLQQGIVNQIQTPDKKAVIQNNIDLLTEFNKLSTLEVLVNVDLNTLQSPDRWADIKQNATYNAESISLIPEIATFGNKQNVYELTKYNPSAFFGSSLDSQLRRRNIDTVIITGVATSNGVYATAQDAYQHGYNVVVAQDACMDSSIELQQIFLQQLLPKKAFVRSTKDILNSVHNI